MLAYRHAFHAGNHADVLKHATLVAVLRHLNAKDKGWRLLDTHAGAGAYTLHSDAAQKLGEYRQGIARLWQQPSLPPLLADYLGGVAIKAGDIVLLENVRFNAGFAAIKAQLPPPSRRGLLLMDPSYELKTDYPAVHNAAQEALARFAEGVVMVWYPQIDARESANLPVRLKALANAQARKGWLHARLTVAEPNDRGFGMLGSGVFVINPPHTLRAQLREALPVLVKLLGQHAGAGQRLELSAEA